MLENTVLSNGFTVLVDACRVGMHALSSKMPEEMDSSKMQDTG